MAETLGRLVLQYLGLVSDMDMSAAHKIPTVSTVSTLGDLCTPFSSSMKASARVSFEISQRYPKRLVPDNVVTALVRVGAFRTRFKPPHVDSARWFESSFA